MLQAVASIFMNVTIGTNHWIYLHECSNGIKSCILCPYVRVYVSTPVTKNACTCQFVRPYPLYKRTVVRPYERTTVRPYVSPCIHPSESRIKEVLPVRAFLLNAFSRNRPLKGVANCAISCESPLGPSFPLRFARYACLVDDKNKEGGNR